MPDWITVTSASRKAGVSDRTIRNWIDKGRIVAKKEKGRWLVDESSLAEIGKGVSDVSGKSESPETIPVPLEHYDGLMTRLGQLEAENRQYRLMLEAHDSKLEQSESEKEQYRTDLEAREKEIEGLRGELEHYRQPFYRRWFKRRRTQEGER